VRLAKRTNVVIASPTLALDARTKELVAQGIDIVSFGVGEPDFDTPAHVKEAAIKAINDNFTHYPPNPGIPDLRAAVCKKFKEDNGLDYKPSQVLVSCGAKHSIFNAIMALVGEGDEAIIPSPFWVSYPEMVKIAGGTPVIVATAEKDNFKITAERLEAAITPKTTCMFLNSPSNPTGAVYSKDELLAVAEVCKKHDIIIISDEIYEKLLYDKAQHVSIAALSEDAKRRTITVNGVSKAYAMTGWRIGYAAGDPKIIQAMADIQSHATSAASGISQKAAVAGLLGPQQPLKDMLEQFRKRAEYMHERINKIPGFFCRKPTGAFYVFPNVSAHYGKSYEGEVVTDGDKMCSLLLEKARVAISPGAGFGNPENIRLSYATSLEQIKEGLDRVEAFVARLK
jgi:aspartate aminotransferase